MKYSSGIITSVGTVDTGMPTNSDIAMALKTGSAFNAQFFSNRMLWLSLGVAPLLQLLATKWGPATRLFGTTGMAWAD